MMVRFKYVCPRYYRVKMAGRRECGYSSFQEQEATVLGESGIRSHQASVSMFDSIINLETDLTQDHDHQSDW